MKKILKIIIKYQNRYKNYGGSPYGYIIKKETFSLYSNKPNHYCYTNETHITREIDSSIKYNFKCALRELHKKIFRNYFKAS